MLQYDTFLSYSHRDMDRATKVKEHLDKAGLRVWMDVHRIPLGGLIRHSISSALRESRTITPILTQNSLESDEVFKEVKFGIDAGMKIIPVVLSPSGLINSRRWIGMLSQINWGRIDGTAESRNITQELLSDIEKAIRNSDERRCPVLCVYHFKGGVGKTTICAHLAAQLYHQKQSLSVLVIDCDAQSNLSSVFLTRQTLDRLSFSSQNLIGMLEPNRLRAEAGHFQPYDVAGGQVDNNTIFQVQTTLHTDDKTGKRFSIIPNCIAATKYGASELDKMGLVFQNFQNAIQKLSYEFDIMLLDCNPSATLLSECALHAATDIIVPIRNDKYTTDGLENIDKLLKDRYQLNYSYGQGRRQKQMWTLINFADRTDLSLSSERRSFGSGHEAELLKKFFSPLKGEGGQDLSHFRPSLLETRIPESGFLASKPVATAPLNPDRPSSRNLLSFFGNTRARPVETAINDLANEVYEKTRSTAIVVAV